MGNYKEGNLTFFLKKDTPLTLIDSLIDLITFNSDLDGKTNKDNRIKKLRVNRSEDFFKSDILDSFRIEIGFLKKLPWVQNENNIDWVSIQEVYAIDYATKNYATFGVTEVTDILYKMSEPTITQYKKGVRTLNFESYAVTVYVCSKEYTNEFDTICSLLLPYLIEGHPKELGYIKDEDGYLGKTYYVNPNEFLKKMKSRKYICNGCKNYNLNCDCDLFENCKRAYNKGRRSVQK